jgi:hypothetical protein
MVTYCRAMQIHIPFHWTLRTHAGRCPRLFNTVFGSVNDGDRLTDKETGLVIEGFPRSGNSFSVFAFSNAGADDLAIAHHVHSPSQIITAARYATPAILLIRSPKDAVTAGLAKIATHRTGDLLRAYTAYYRSLLPLRESYVIAPFETVTADFGRIIDAVNRRFGTTFTKIDVDRHLALSQKFLAQEKFDALNAGAPAGTSDRAPRFNRYSGLLKRAEAEHARFSALAAGDGTARLPERA